MYFNDEQSRVEGGKTVLVTHNLSSEIDNSAKQRSKF